MSEQQQINKHSIEEDPSFAWVENFDLFLFDLDGLLINTDELLFKGFQKAFRQLYGKEVSWSFEKYCRCTFSHFDGNLWETLLREYPEVVPATLRPLKFQYYTEFVLTSSLKLKPGVEKLLSLLRLLNKQCCVVTQSSTREALEVKSRIPVLDSITHWFTRESFSKSKPNPEPYGTAIKAVAKENDRIIGFEDTPGGVLSLLGNKRVDYAVLVSPIYYPDISEFKKDARFVKISNFNEMEKLSFVELSHKKRKITNAEAEHSIQILNSVDVK